MAKKVVNVFDLESALIDLTDRQEYPVTLTDCKIEESFFDIRTVISLVDGAVSFEINNGGLLKKSKTLKDGIYAILKGSGKDLEAEDFKLANLVIISLQDYKELGLK